MEVTKGTDTYSKRATPMSSLLNPLKRRLLAAACAGLLAVGALTAGPLVPAYAQATTVGASRATDVLPQANQERRIALVIGNSSYENVTVLPNPANDARDVSKFLNSAGFEVIQATNLEHDEIMQVMQNFSAKVAERGPNTVALVFYAGHGLQINGENYLVPVDANIDSEADVAREAVRLVDVMATLKAVPTRVSGIIVDACRNNPFSKIKDTRRSLAIVDAPTGSIVAYSTAPGDEAFDGDGDNSPYTEAFLRLAPQPNLPIEQLFKKLRVAVNDATDGKQTPWETSSLTTDFYFFGNTELAAKTRIDHSIDASSRQTVVAQNIRARTSRDAYKLAIQEGSTEYYEEYVRVYPTDPYAAHIRRLLAARVAAVAWHHAVKVNSPGAYQAFYRDHSDSPYASNAMKLWQQPRSMQLYQPTKIMIAPQIAPQVKLTNFNGVNIGQGNNAPIGLGGNGSLFNKKIQLGNGGLGNGGIGNGGLPNGGQLGPKVGLPANVNGNPVGNAGQVLNNGKPNGVGLPANTGIAGGIKGVGTPGNGTAGNGVPGNVKVLNGNTGIVGRPNGNGQVLTGAGQNGSPLINRVERPRVTMPVQKQTTITEKPMMKRFEPRPRLQLNGNGGNNNGNGGSNIQFRKFNTGNGSSLGGIGGGRIASGGFGGFGRMR
jgi:hypothetical protein